MIPDLSQERFWLRPVVNWEPSEAGAISQLHYCKIYKLQLVNPRIAQT